jgi:hypothetical protein
MSRRISVVLGCCLLVLGVLVGLSGAALLVAFGPADGLHTGSQPVATSSRALVTKTAQIAGVPEADRFLGQTRIDVRATARSGDKGVFVGIGPAADVDRYLAGADIEVVTDFETTPFRLAVEPRPGSAAIPAPGSQGFWVARGDASSRLSWTVRDGDYRLVIMNADASPGVSLDADFGIAMPAGRPLAVWVLVVGLALLAGGVVLLVLGQRTAATRPVLPIASTGSGTSPQQTTHSTGVRP